MLYTGLLHESRSCAECGTHLCWTNRHAYTNADRHTNSDPIGHAKRNAHSYGYSHNYTYNYAYSYTYRYCNSNSNAHFNTKGPSARSSDATSAPQSVSVIGRARLPTILSQHQAGCPVSPRPRWPCDRPREEPAEALPQADIDASPLALNAHTHLHAPAIGSASGISVF